MASIQQSFRDYIAPALQTLGVTRVGLLYVPEARQDGTSVTCSIEVTGATFEAQQQLDEAPLVVTTDLSVDFVYDTGVDRPQDKRDAVYAYFTKSLHNFAGQFQTRRGNAMVTEPYNIMFIALTGYAQGIQEGTKLRIESYGVRIKHHEIESRAPQ